VLLQEKIKLVLISLVPCRYTFKKEMFLCCFFPIQSDKRSRLVLEDAKISI